MARAAACSPGAAASIALPSRPLHLMYAEPARAFIESRGGVVRTGALARVLVENGRPTAVDVRGERLPADRIVAAVPWFELRTLFAAVPDALREIVSAADAMTSMPIVTVNLWYDRRVMEEPFVGLPGRAMQWAFDKRLAFGREASHLSLISSGATELVGMTNDALCELAAREIRDGIPGARAARLAISPRAFIVQIVGPDAYYLHSQLRRGRATSSARADVNGSWRQPHGSGPPSTNTTTSVPRAETHRSASRTVCVRPLRLALATMCSRSAGPTKRRYSRTMARWRAALSSAELADGAPHQCTTQGLPFATRRSASSGVRKSGCRVHGASSARVCLRTTLGCFRVTRSPTSPSPGDRGLPAGG